jgi:2-isopropylmalate synthase
MISNLSAVRRGFLFLTTTTEETLAMPELLDATVLKITDLQLFLETLDGYDEQKLQKIRWGLESALTKNGHISHKELERIISRCRQLLDERICFSHSDITAIATDVISEMRQKHKLELVDFLVVCRQGSYNAGLELKLHGETFSRQAEGSGAIHAIINCFRQTFSDLRLQIYRCNCLSSNENGSLHQAFVRLLYNHQEGESDAVETDLILATIRAIIKALNRTL